MNDAHTRERLLSPLWRRLRLLVSRGVLRRSDSSKGLQRLQAELLAGETRDLEHLEQYGYTSRPLKGAETVHLAVGGVRGHLIALLAADRRHRLRDLKPGEVSMYTDEGDRIVLRRGRIIEVIAGNELQVTAPLVTVTATTKVILDTPLTELSGDLTVAGKITGQSGMAISGGSGVAVEGGLATTQDVVADQISLQTHIHEGVMAGGDTTGEPVS